MNFAQLFQLPGDFNFMSGLDNVKLRGANWRYIWKEPIQVGLTNLTELEVYDCNRLTSIFPLKLVRNLGQLRTLKITSCKRVEQIIVNDDLSASSVQGHDNDETSSGIQNQKEMMIFPELKKLRLEYLPSLMRFSSVGDHLHFPSLKWLEIKYCSQMITSFNVEVLPVDAETEVPIHQTPTIK